MGYIISEEAQDILKDVKKFCDKEIRDKVKEFDITGEFPKELYKKAGEQGYTALEVPEKYGGMGLSRTDIAAIVEEVAKADAGLAVGVFGTGLALKPLIISGNEELLQRACEIALDGGLAAFAVTEPEAGSDAAAGKTTALKDGDSYILNGRKCFITNGAYSDFYCITAMTDKSKGVNGISMFYVEKGTSGLSFGNDEDKMGLRTSNTCDVILDNCKIPAKNLIGKEGEGLKIALKTLDQARAWVACMAVGIAQRAMEEAIAYTKTREQFKKPIIKNQAMLFKISDMRIGIETARAMTANALNKMDMGLDYSVDSAIAKCYASDVAVRVTTEAIQAFGGYGYSREYPVEKLLRDAKIFQIFEGTNEICRMVIGNKTIA